MKTKNESAVNEIEMREASESHAGPPALIINSYLFISHGEKCSNYSISTGEESALVCTCFATFQIFSILPPNFQKLAPSLSQMMKHLNLI